jgi:hypothetical protein
MFLHGVPRSLRGGLADRGVNSVLKPKPAFRSNAIRKLPHTHEERTMDSLEQEMADAVSAGPKDPFVKSQIRIVRYSRVVLLRSISKSVAQGGQVFHSRAFSGLRGQLGPYHRPGFKEFVLREIVSKHKEVEGFMENCFRALAEMCAVSDLSRKHTHNLKASPGPNEQGRDFRRIGGQARAPRATSSRNEQHRW